MLTNKMEIVSSFSKLVRFKLSLAITLSAFVGYVFYRHSLDLALLPALSGVFLFASSASALNQFQERHFDQMMKRTVNRPIPSHQVRPVTALILSIALGICAFVLLYVASSPTSANIGLLNLLWYNFLYTPLKRRTSFVVIIGAVTGALPPLMGWTAAGGIITSPVIVSFCIFMFFWQIPHFLLLLLKYGKEYADAGYPSITTSLSDEKVKRVIFIWILSTSTSTLLFPLFHNIENPILISLLILLNIFTIMRFYHTFFKDSSPLSLRIAFRSIHIFQLCVFLLLLIQSFIFY